MHLNCKIRAGSFIYSSFPSSLWYNTFPGRSYSPWGEGGGGWREGLPIYLSQAGTLAVLLSGLWHPSVSQSVSEGGGEALCSGKWTSELRGRLLGIVARAWKIKTNKVSVPRSLYFVPQSRQSAKLFIRSSELGLLQPLSRRRLCKPPAPPGSGGRGTLERGVGRVPIPTRGHTLWYSLYIRTLCFVLYTDDFHPGIAA